MRAFARQLGVDPSLLPKVLRGKRPASAELVKAIGPSIGLTPQRISKFLKGQEEIACNGVSEDIFVVISDSNWIARRLSIHKTEVETALE